MFFEDISRLKALTEPKVLPCGRTVDNTLLRRVFSTLGYPARACHVIAVPTHLTLWSGQLSQLHVAFAQILRCQNVENSRELDYASLVDHQSGKTCNF